MNGSSCAGMGELYMYVQPTMGWIETSASGSCKRALQSCSWVPGHWHTSRCLSDSVPPVHALTNQQLYQLSWLLCSHPPHRLKYSIEGEPW